MWLRTSKLTAIFMHCKSWDLKRNKIKCEWIYPLCIDFFTSAVQSLSATSQRSQWSTTSRTKKKKKSVEHPIPQPLLYYSLKVWGYRDNSRGRRLCHWANDWEANQSAFSAGLHTVYLIARSVSVRLNVSGKVRKCARGSRAAGEARGGEALVSGGEAPRDASYITSCS